MLLYKIFTYKQHLIVIVRHKSCIVNRQYGLGNSKYAVILDPLPTGHVTQSMHSELFSLQHGLNASLRPCISVMVQTRHMVPMDH